MAGERKCWALAQAEVASTAAHLQRQDILITGSCDQTRPVADCAVYPCPALALCTLAVRAYLNCNVLQHHIHCWC